ncbi:uncharacterized protein LOC105694113 [Athalia rosae]|uniref:uncharacterized protein LOC105694113 n=1 Tax=Athalia rosae TaxID=37344 RepID=UPI000A0EE81A|nr:uncharacterized protein LOC105694113 [Athalia rosae]
MNYSVVLLVIVALVASCQAKAVGESPANNPVPLADLITQAQADIAKLGRELHENLKLPDQETIVNALKDHSNTLVTNVKSYVNQVTEDVAKKRPEMEKLWTSVKTALNKAADDIADQIPVAKEQAAQLEAKFFKGVETIVQQSDIVAKTFNENSGQIQEDVAKLAKKAVEMAVQATQGLKAQLHPDETVATPKQFKPKPK